MKSAADRPKVGLVGVSGFAQTHFKILCELHDAGRLEFRAAVENAPEAQRAASPELEARKIIIYPRFERFLEAHAGELDLCVISTGIASHAPLTIGALRAGMNVLVEKPLAGSLADVDAVRKAEAGAADRFVAVGFQDMYHESTPWLKAALCAGAIGKIGSIRVLGGWPRVRDYYQRNSWAGRLLVDGAPVFDSPLQNAFAHFVHLALFFGGTEFGQMATVKVLGAELLRTHAIESFDTGVVRARSPDGVEFWFGATHACRAARQPRIRIEGTRGRMDWQVGVECSLTAEDGTSERRPLPEVTVVRRRVYESVLRRLHDPGVFISTTDMAAAHSELIASIHKLARINVVDPALIDDYRPEGAASSVPAVLGIEDALDRAFASGSTLSQSGFSLQPQP